MTLAQYLDNGVIGNLCIFFAEFLNINEFHSLNRRSFDSYIARIKDGSIART